MYKQEGHGGTCLQFCKGATRPAWQNRYAARQVLKMQKSVCFCAANLGNCTVQRCVEVVAETCHSVLNLAGVAAALESTCTGCQMTVVEQLLDLHSINDIIC